MGEARKEELGGDASGGATGQHAAQLSRARTVFMESSQKVLQVLSQSVQAAQDAEAAAKQLHAENSRLKRLLDAQKQGVARCSQISMDSIMDTGDGIAGTPGLRPPRGGTPTAWMVQAEIGEDMTSISTVPLPSREEPRMPLDPAPKSNVLVSSDGEADLGNPVENFESIGSRVSGSESLTGSAPMAYTLNFKVNATWKKGRLHRAVTAPLSVEGGSALQIGNEAELDPAMSVQMSQWGELMQSGTLVDNSSCLRCVILHPQCGKRVFWDILNLVLILYDLVFLPLQVFDIPSNAFSDFMTMLTRIFWTVDIFVSSVTGYITHTGAVDLRWRHIVFRYLRTWFLLDAALVIFEWVDLLLLGREHQSTSLLGRAGRTLRLVRMVRLIRLMRMKQIVSTLIMQVHSEKALLMVEICKTMGVIIGSAHLVACLWYWIGTREVTRAWVSEGGWTSMDLSYRYMSSMHWSLSQLTGGMDEIHPQNTFERVFTIVAFLVSFIVAAVFISNITSSMTRLDIISTGQATQAASLRRFLMQHRISHKLVMRLQRNAMHAVKEQEKMIHESGVDLLNKISEPLRIELHFEMYSMQLGCHTFFREYTQQCPHVMRRVCHQATEMKFVSCGDLIFSAGEMPAKPKMYIVVKGELHYSSIFGIEDVVDKESCVSEATLWTSWVHRGCCTATTDTSFCTLDASGFMKICLQFDHPKFDPCAYAAAVVSDLNAFQEEVSDITDFLELDSAVAAMKWKHKPSRRLTAARFRGSIDETFSLRSVSGGIPRDGTRRELTPVTRLQSASISAWAGDGTGTSSSAIGAPWFHPTSASRPDVGRSLQARSQSPSSLPGGAPLEEEDV